MILSRTDERPAPAPRHAAVWAMVLAAGSLLPLAARAASLPSQFVEESVAPGASFVDPTAVAFMPGGRLLVAEKRGRVYTVTNGVKSAVPLWSRENEVLEEGDRGLLGLAVDPNYVTNHYIYLFYAVDPDSNGIDTSPNDDFGRLARYQVSFTDSTTVDPASRTILLGVSWRYGPVHTSSSHTEGALRWGSDGSLLLTAGDGAAFDYIDPGGYDDADFGTGPDKTDPYENIGAFRAQSLSSLNGKLLRINPVNGAGYRSNPYFDGNPYSARSRIWAYGFRNPFRFSIRPQTGVADTSVGNPGSIYVGDVGFNTWEEVDVVQPGANYGWPCYEAMSTEPSYSAANPAHNGCGSMGTADNPVFQSTPIMDWHHSNASVGNPPGLVGNCVIGGPFYTGLSYPAGYRGAYFFADYVAGWIRAARVDAADQLVSVTDFASGANGVVDIVADPQGGDLVYVNFSTGDVRRIRFTGVPGNAPAIAVAAASPTFGVAPLTVDFSSAGTFDPEGSPVTLSWQFGDGPGSSQANPSHTYLAPGTYTVVLTADDGQGGIGTDTLLIMVSNTAAFPTAPVLDSFNRANGGLGSSWVDQPAGLSINANALVSSGAFCVTEWGGATFGPNQEVYVTIVNTSASAAEQDLLLKVQGEDASTAEIEVWYSAPDARVYVYTYATEQGWIEHGSIGGVTFTSGQRFGARALADGTVDVYRDAVWLGSVSVAGWPYAAQGGRIGLSLTGAAGSRYDDFGGGNVNLGVSASPVVTVTSPVGGEALVGGSEHNVSWTATDDVAVTGVDVFFRDAASSAWQPLSLLQPNTGSFAWSVHNLPSTTVRVKVVAHDGSGNVGSDSSHANVTITATPGGRVATTLRDFFQPGTQPLQAGSFVSNDACYTCHGGYNVAVEPGKNFRGSMMAQAGRDPLFYACLAIAEQDAPSSGDMCLRCHAPMDWLTGKSQPTSGAKLGALGRDGVSCDFCHRMVDPVYQAGISPSVDQAVLGGMLPSHVPTSHSNGQYVVDSDPRRRGPFSDPATPHTFLTSSFHKSSDLCGTCHDVSNPVFARAHGSKYIAGPLNTPADSITSTALLPLERTYSEWKASAYPAGVFAPEFAGNAPGGMVSSCQDCHLRDVTGAGCNYGSPPVRTNLPLHDLMGGNAWMGGVIASLYPGETDSSALNAGANRAASMLQKAAKLDVHLVQAGDSLNATVVVTNQTGHKLPTGYPEGRRMWLNVVARNAGGTVIYESAHYDRATGVLTEDADARVYEVKLGLSPSFASSIGLPAGPSFHFALNDTLYQDNRIPPAGYTHAAFDAFGGVPVDPDGAGYADGQNWDVVHYALPAGVASVTATLYYQTTSKPYIEFLKNQNVTNTAGQILLDAWQAHGRAAPVVMARDSVSGTTLGTPPGSAPRELSLRPLANPFHGKLELALELPQAADVRWEIVDVMGRIVRRMPSTRLAQGEHRLAWDGHAADGHAVTPGAYWASVWVGSRRLVRPVVALR